MVSNPTFRFGEVGLTFDQFNHLHKELAGLVNRHTNPKAIAQMAANVGINIAIPAASK